MAEIKIYSRSWCSFCHRAKSLLDSKGLTYQEIDIEQQPQARAEMIELSGGHTVPQLFINQQAIGGCDDLMALHASGKLDEMLA